MRLRVALFNAADFYQASRFPSLGLGYLVSYLRKYSSFKDVHIIEGSGMAGLRRLEPDVVGIYSVTQTYEQACAIARLIRAEYPRVPIIIGGYHITALPYLLPELFDIGVLREGEETLKELLEVIADNGLDPRALAGVRGIAFHDRGQVKVTEPRAHIRDIDSIPFPARDAFSRTGRGFVSTITSRGCPYKCIFCSSVDFWGAPRFHSPGYVVDELEEIIRTRGAIHISIWDDLFIAPLPRFEEICALVIKKKIHKKVSFGCALRSNLVTDKLCASLRGMNVRRVSIGFESGSQKVLDTLKCGSVTVEQHMKAVELCRAHGIYVTGTFMIGNPGEGREDLQMTLDLVKRLRLDGGGVISLAAPFPGTRLWEYAKREGLVASDAQAATIGLMNTDFTDPAHFKGILLTREVPLDEFFGYARRIQEAANAHFVRGLLRMRIFSVTYLRYLIARPRECLALAWYLVKYVARRSSVME
ncbi:MAG: radical SAM protein, partial [Candidatus Omnitrophota bacterium]